MQRHHLKVCLVVALVLGGLSIVSGVSAASPSWQDIPVHIYFFWGEGCPHCAAAKPFLDDLALRYPQVEVVAFEVYNSPDNQALFKDMAAAHGFEPRYVPTIFVGDQHWEGFADQLREQIEAAVRGCVEEGCPDAGEGIIPSGEGSGGAPNRESPSLQAVLFFGADSCPQCDATQENHITQSGFLQIGSDSGTKALQFLRGLEDEHTALEVSAYDVWIGPTHAPYFREVAGAFNVEAAGVPMLFVGDRVWQGFDAETAAAVQAYIEDCLAEGCSGPLGDYPGSPEEPAASLSSSEASLTVPLFGTLDLGGKSLWTSTALISFVDGFNPCSLWVLSILIALTLRTGSRKRIFTIGLIYIAVTAGVYVLFIAGLFTVLSVVSFLGWIQAAVSVLALFFAAVNIKDYFWYKEGLSFTIADEKKPGIYRRMRKVLNAGDSFWALAGATVALGAGVSLVEFSCTAGFPVIWTNLVSAQGVAPLTFTLLLLLYMVIYQLDELAIFGVAVATLKVSRLEEKHGRILKLIGGTTMLSLAGVMLINPALMNELGTSLLIFGVAMGAAFLVLVIHRRLLPRLGIYIGTELTSATE